MGPDEMKSKWPGVPLLDVRAREHDVPSPNTTMYVVCGSGKRSTQVVSLLTEDGFDVANVAGGITERYRDGYPVTYATATKSVPADRPKRPSSWSLGAVLNKFRRTR
ncbi:rhodanese-like domain-containing protein [Arthrobacter sp. TMN-50]